MVKVSMKKPQNGIYKFNVPFTVTESLLDNSAMSDDRVYISGVAINETTTRNGHTFTAEELALCSHTLCDKPLLADHNNSIYSIIGRTTTKCAYDGNNKCTLFEAWVSDKDVKERIKDGRIKSVSVGAMVSSVDPITDEESGEILSYKLSGITFVELSLVAVPADPNAGLTQAIAESLEILEEKPIQSTVMEEQAMAEAQEALKMLQEKKAALQAEVEEMQIKSEINKLEQAKAGLKLQTESLEAQTQSKTKGEVTSVVEQSKESLPFNVVGENTFGKYGFEMNYASYKTSRMTR
jgi:hypothetical protein